MPAKGQSLSEEQRQGISRTKVLKWKQELVWSNLDEKYWDVIPKGYNQKSKIISFRQFKELVESGKSKKDLIADGVSDNLLTFYSVLAKGELKLDSEHFISDYHSGMSLDEIRNKYGISEENISCLRKLYGCKTTGAKFQARKKTEQPITQRQKEIIYGAFMGDGSRMSPNAIRIKHGPKQKDYVYWKYKELQSIASREPYLTTEFDKRFQKDIISWIFYTKANSDVELIVSQFYNNEKKKKIVTPGILEQLTPLSIAIWFQDDGKTDFNRRGIFVGQAAITPSAIFCTESFSLDECQMICDWFKAKYNIEAVLRNCKKGKRYRIRIVNFYDFVELIKPYVFPLFQYKIDYKANVEWAKADESQILLADIIRCPRGEEFIFLSRVEQDELVSKWVTWLYSRGFSKLVSDSMSARDGRKVFEFDTTKIIHPDSISMGYMGSKFVQSFFPGYWEAKAKGNKSPKEIFEDKRFLTEITRSILIKGKAPKGKHILQRLRFYRGNKAVSFFAPCVAKAVYDKYALPNARVLDFCAGYGGRLMGAIASKSVMSYTGIETDKNSYEGLNRLFWHLSRKEHIEKPASIIHGDSIEEMKRFSDNSFDLGFTSPPYFDSEIYSDETSQSIHKYPQYGQWLNEYLLVALKEASRICKKVVINIANTGSYPVADDVRKWINESGMELIEESKLISSKFGGGNKAEPLFVFKKGESNENIPKDLLP